MAALGAGRAALAALALAACDDLAGFDGEVPPLATVAVEVTGSLDDVRVPGADDEALRAAVVWATLWVMSQAEGPDPSAVAAAPIGSSGWPSLAPYVLAALAVIFARRLPPRSSAEG